MEPLTIINQLELNGEVFDDLLTGVPKEQIAWKPDPDKWSLLEVVCHLHDEEREDFRARLRHVLDTPRDPLPSINPVAWVTEREYIKQDFGGMLKKFLAERAGSIDWLRSLKAPTWDNAYQHPKFGAMSARMFLVNWLAHDYFHFRQITRLKYVFLKEFGGEPLDYAGSW